VIGSVGFPPEIQAFLSQELSHSERQSQKVDGSLIGLKAVTYLVRQGFTDEDIESWVESEFPFERKSLSLTRSWIKRARESVGAYKASHPSHPQHTHVIREKQHKSHKRPYNDAVLPFLVLKARREAEHANGGVLKMGDWVKEIMEVSKMIPGGPLKTSAAREVASGLIDKHYLDTEVIRGRGNPKLVRLTEKGVTGGTPTRGGWCKLIWIRTFTGRAEPEETPGLEDLRARQYRPKVKRSRSFESLRRQEVKAYRHHRDVNGNHRLSFKGGKVRYVQLLTAPNAWIGLHVLKERIIGYDEERLPLYLTVPCSENDPEDAWLRDMSKYPTRANVFAGAVELVHGPNGFEVAEHVDQDGVLAPSVGVIMQPWPTFFEPLWHSGHTGRIIRVQGHGRGKERSYTFADAGDPLPLELTFDIDEFHSHLISVTHRERMRNLPPRWFWMLPKRQALVQRLLAKGHAKPGW
jgi:hypothetical protein